MYLIFRNINGYFEEIAKIKYLLLVPTNESKKNNKKYEELWRNTRDLIRSIIKNSNYYDEKYMKIKFKPLNKTIEIATITKACVHYFLSFFFPTRWQPFKNYEKCLLLHLKSSFRSQDIQIFLIFSLPFHTFQTQKDKWEWNNLWCHELDCIILQVEILE